MLGEIESFMLQDKFEPRDASIVGVAAATRLTTAMTTTIAAVAFSDNQAWQTHSPRRKSWATKTATRSAL